MICIVFACLCLCFTTDIEICWPPGTPLSGNADIQNREQWLLYRYSHNVHRIMKVYSGRVSVFQRFSKFLSASSGATFLIYRSVASTTQQMRLATTTTIIVNQKPSCLQDRRWDKYHTYQTLCICAVREVLSDPKLEVRRVCYWHRMSGLLATFARFPCGFCLPKHHSQKPSFRVAPL